MSVVARWKVRLQDRQKVVAESKARDVQLHTQIDREAAAVSAAKRVIARHRKKPLRLRAYDEMVKLYESDVRETGGNNRGPKVDPIILANDGVLGEAWCGDTQALVYRRAGSKSVNRSWAAVRLYRVLSGIVATRKPKRGNVVTFQWDSGDPDHVGMFDRDLGNGMIATFEGNAGTPAGVVKMVRSKSLVAGYYRVLR